MPKVLPEELRARVAARIRELAKARGIALTQLADRAPVSRGHLWRVLGGSASPSIDLVARIAIVLDVDPGELVRKRR